MKKVFLILLSVIMIITMGCNTNTANKKSNSAAELTEFDIYLPDRNAEYLVPTKAKIEPKPEKVIEYLISCKYSEFPKGTKLLGIKVKDHTAYVNLNKKYQTTIIGDTMRVFSIHSIVATLCLNKSFSIDKVQLLVEGKIPVMTPMDVSEPMTINDLKNVVQQNITDKK